MSVPAPGASDHFDAIVVGSGFGGSVTAARLAEAGRRVCLLERGKAYPPTSFPRSPLGMKHNFWDPSEGLHGMFDLWSFDGIDAVCAAGLGGGSLIYANVLLRKDERWFVTEDLARGGYEDWPVTRADLDPHYDEVERRIGVQRYPLDAPPYDRTSKVLAYRDAADRLGLDWSLVPLAVTFANPGAAPVPGEPILEARANLHGRTRQTCRLCGECDVGCNYGAKNTLDYTYLTDAWHAGADLRTRCEVRSFEPRDAGGYAVHYVHHDPEAEGHPTRTAGLPRETLTCDRLILSAGTLGTNWLLQRNRAALPGISPALGRGFSGNGDLLTFALRATQEVDGRRVTRVIDPGHGPVITSAIRVPDTVDGGDGRGFYLEDAGFPEFASWILEMLEEPAAIAAAAPRAAHFVWSMLRGHRQSEMGDLASALLGTCELSSSLMPLLGMGRDIPDGNMSLKDEQLELDWSKHGASSDYFDRVREVSRRVAAELGADLVDNPIWHANRVVTVHGLGGARMGRSPETGVVDSYGRVFGHPGLYIADGSVMPGPVGANPSLTIAALANRFVEAILEEPSSPSGAAPTPPAPAPAPDAGSRPGSASGPPVSLSFTEEMKGYVTFGESDFDRGYRTGKKAGTAFMFHLTITADDVEGFIADPKHTGRAEGWIESDAFGGRMPVTRGVFNLFVDQDSPAHKRMFYRLEFADGEQHPLTMTGYKEVLHDRPLDEWSDTTTLFTRVLSGHVAEGSDAGAEVVAGGILHIHPLDFARQMTTFRVVPADRVDALGRFGLLFAGDLWSVYRPGARA
ncbi:MAG: cholesterol oxidase [Solirubrobacteraceae bacterium]|jgi:cholesterol oxidase|nr:cholesterol oxidase [Solirubrobacteraceae bacterium]